MRNSIDTKYRKFWPNYFRDNLIYSPFYENYPYHYSINEDYYVHFTFMKPTSHEYVICDCDEDRSKFYMKQTVTEARQEEINIMQKSFSRNIVQRFFKKETSVFAPWKMDNTKEIESGFEKDISAWKVPRFVKDEQDYADVCKYMQDRATYLKTVYIVLISSSNYPAITWNDFTSFVNSCKLIDENLSLSTVDRLFIATKSSSAAGLKDFPERDLARFEFYEILVRMAASKYKDPGKTETYCEAIRKLIEEDLMTYFSVSKWQVWREKELWTLEVNDLLSANLETLKKIFKQFHTTQKTYMEPSDALTLLLRNTGLIPIDKEVVTCYGLSKSTVANEFARRKEYSQMSFVEFLEFIARASELRHKYRKFKPKQAEEEKGDFDSSLLTRQISFTNSATRNDDPISLDTSDPKLSNLTNTAEDTSSLIKTLTQKLEDMFDELFPIYSLKRKEVKISVEFETDSEGEGDE